MEPLLLSLPIAVTEVVVFYRLHWPHRHLLPERFRAALLAKGVGKAVSYLCLTAFAAWLNPWLGWAVAVGQPLVGGVFHFLWCRSHGIDPVRVQPRKEYVLATTAWVEKLIAYEEERSRRAP